jgi:streptogramin lyase
MMWRRFHLVGAIVTVLALVVMSPAAMAAARPAVSIAPGSRVRGTVGLNRIAPAAGRDVGVVARAGANAAGPNGQRSAFTGINQPTAITTGPDGALWFTNVGNNTIGRITTNEREISTFNGRGIDRPAGITTGPDGALWFANSANASIGRITTAGVVTNYTAAGISGPAAIAAGPDGALWFVNYRSSTIGRITTSGRVTIYTGDGISGPDAITAGPDGAMWFTDYGNDTIGRITISGVVTTYTASTVKGPDGARRASTRSRHARRRATCSRRPRHPMSRPYKDAALPDENISRASSEEKCSRNELMSSRVGCWKG